MPISIPAIQACLSAGRIEFTFHAIIEAASDLLFVDEIECALGGGEIIEDEPHRFRCLVLLNRTALEPMHVVIDYRDWLDDPQSNLVIVTVYRPDPRNWIDHRTRRT